MSTIRPWAAGLAVACFVACAPHGTVERARVYDVAVRMPGGLEFDSKRATVRYPGCPTDREVEMVLSDAERHRLWRLVADTRVLEAGPLPSNGFESCRGWRVELHAGALTKAVEPTYCSLDERLDLLVLGVEMRSMFAERPQWRKRLPPGCGSAHRAPPELPPRPDLEPRQRGPAPKQDGANKACLEVIIFDDEVPGGQIRLDAEGGSPCGQARPAPVPSAPPTPEADPDGKAEHQDLGGVRRLEQVGLLHEHTEDPASRLARPRAGRRRTPPGSRVLHRETQELKSVPY